MDWVDIFFFPLGRISFWLVSSLTMAAVRLVTVYFYNFWLLPLPLGPYFSLADPLPVLAGIIVYLLWALYGKISGKCAEQKPVKVKFSAALAVTLTSKIFWFAWALSGAALQYALNISGSAIPIFTILWLTVMLILFIVKNMRG